MSRAEILGSCGENGQVCFKEFAHGYFGSISKGKKKKNTVWRLYDVNTGLLKKLVHVFRPLDSGEHPRHSSQLLVQIHCCLLWWHWKTNQWNSTQAHIQHSSKKTLNIAIYIISDIEEKRLLLCPPGPFEFEQAPAIRLLSNDVVSRPHQPSPWEPSIWWNNFRFGQSSWHRDFHLIDMLSVWWRLYKK